MGIRFTCPNGHRLHVKSHLAGKAGSCPQCGAKVRIPHENEGEPADDAAVEPSPAAELAAIAPAPQTVGATRPQQVVASPALPSVSSSPSASASSTSGQRAASAPGPVVVAEAPRVAEGASRGRPIRDPRLVAAVRQRQRRNAMIGLSLAILVLAGILAWVLSR